ncbi:hypothetical protein AAG906_006843 [Vitis piasezkii]
MDHIERIRQLRVSDNLVVWDDLDGIPMAVYQPNLGCLTLRGTRAGRNQLKDRCQLMWALLVLLVRGLPMSSAYWALRDLQPHTLHQYSHVMQHSHAMQHAIQDLIDQGFRPYMSSIDLNWLFRPQSLIATAIALGYASSNFGPSTQTIRAYDSTKRRPTLDSECWSHSFSIHQKVKFIHDGQVIIVQFTRDTFASSEPMLQISHSEDDLFLIGFIFDEDDISTSLERVRAQSSHILFDYYVRPYSMSLADYFGIVGVFSSIQEAELQYLVHQLQLSDGAPSTFASTLAASSSPDHMSLLTIYFPDKVDECGTFVEIRDMVDGVVPHNEYIDEILVMGISQIDRIVQPELALLFDLFKVSTIKVVEEIQTVPALKLSKDVIVVYDLFKDYEISQHDSNEDSSSASDPNPIDQRVSPTTETLRMLISYRLPLLPHPKPIKQKLRRLHPCWSLQVNEEIQKQLSVGFLSMVEYPEWHNKILMAPKDMINMSFITKWDHLTALERFFERIRQFKLRLNPKKCTFGVTSRKLLGYMVSERSIEADPDKIRVILDMPALRTKKEIRGFLGRLYIVADHLASLPVSNGRAIDDDFPDEDITAGDWKTRDVKLRLYHAYLELLVGRFDDLRCPECQMHGNLIHMPPSELHALTLPWSFSVWGIDIIGKIMPKSSSGHEFILVSIDYFTKWVEATSYAILTLAMVASFIISHIICRYEVPHELISDKGVYLKANVDTLLRDMVSNIIGRLHTGYRLMRR